MKNLTQERITLLLLIGLVLFFTSNPFMTTTLSQQIEFIGHDDFVRAYSPHEAILLDGNDEMMILAEAEKWPGEGTEESPYMITGYYFYDITHSVEIRNIDLYWVFSDNEINGPANSEVWCGMEISNSRNGLVTNNLIHNRFRGLWLIDIYDVVITNNIIEDNLLHGIECVGFINKCVISDNTLRRNDGSGIRILTGVDSEISGNHIIDNDGTGIQIMSTTINCELADNEIDSVTGLGIHLGPSTTVSIMHNEISNTSGDCVYVLESDNLEIFNNSLDDGGEDGIVVRKCRFDLIHNNTISGCDGNGIQIQSGGNSTFRFNHIEGCTGYGLKAASAAENMTITRNVFINNGQSTQIFDDGKENIFVYNYYDDWASPDDNSDQIVDVPYTLDGASENEDPFPLATPNAIPPSPETNNATTITTTDNGHIKLQLPLEVVGVGGVVVIVVVAVFFLKRRG